MLVECREREGEARLIVGLGMDFCLRAGSVRQVGSRFGKGYGNGGVGGWSRRVLYGGGGLVSCGDGMVLVLVWGGYVVAVF